MKKKRHTTEEIIRILRQADGGKTVEEVWPSPALKEKRPPDTSKMIPMSDFTKSGYLQYPDILLPIWDEINELYGTDLKPEL